MALGGAVMEVVCDSFPLLNLSLQRFLLLIRLLQPFQKPMYFAFYFLSLQYLLFGLVLPIMQLPP
jgi:hypothetical protein